jgi:hypothetical protein
MSGAVCGLPHSVIFSSIFIFVLPPDDGETKFHSSMVSKNLLRVKLRLSLTVLYICEVLFEIWRDIGDPYCNILWFV